MSCLSPAVVGSPDPYLSSSPDTQTPKKRRRQSRRTEGDLEKHQEVAQERLKKLLTKSPSQLVDKFVKYSVPCPSRDLITVAIAALAKNVEEIEINSKKRNIVGATASLFPYIKKMTATIDNKLMKLKKEPLVSTSLRSLKLKVYPAKDDKTVDLSFLEHLRCPVLESIEIKGKGEDQYITASTPKINVKNLSALKKLTLKGFVHDEPSALQLIGNLSTVEELDLGTLFYGHYADCFEALLHLRHLKKVTLYEFLLDYEEGIETLHDKEKTGFQKLTHVTWVIRTRRPAEKFMGLLKNEYPNHRFEVVEK